MVKKKQEPKDVPLSQIIKDREGSMERAEELIITTEEEIKYKENQLKGEIVEENVSTLYPLISYPLDHKKPRHTLKIEIDILKKNKKNHLKNLEVMRKLQVEDEKKNAT